MSDPLVSICMPVYNGEKYLAQAIESALAQTCREHEVLLVDDGSTDSSRAIAQVYSQKDARVRVIQNERNLGLVANWNRCIELARGEWIKYLFQDDLLLPTCVERLLARGREGSRFVACDRDFIFEGEVTEQVRGWYQESRDAINGWLAATGGADADAYARKALKGLHINLVGEPPVTLIAASAMQEAGPFNTDLVQLCDVEYWHKLGSNFGVAYVNEPLARFRVHAAATTATNRLNKSFVALGIDKLMLAYSAARAPQCAPLRKIALEAHPPLSLEKHFHERAHLVHEWVAAHASEPCGDREVGEVYADFLATHPECRVGGLLHWFWSLRTWAWRRRNRPTEIAKAVL